MLLSMKFCVLTRCLACASLLAGAVRGAPLPPADYLVDGWDTEHNLPSSTVTSLAQTPDGYLWVGTYNGLARFDGARFVTFDPVTTPELGQPRVQGLFLDAAGTLWINTFRGGLTSYRSDRNGAFRNEWPDQATFDLHTTLVASTSNLVTFVTQFGEVLQRNPVQTNQAWQVFTPAPGLRPIFQCVGSDGKLWFLARDGHIVQFAGGEFQKLAGDGGLGGSHINSLVADPQGRVWAGAENKIACWDGGQFVAMTPTNGVEDIQPLLLFPTRAGELWVLDGERLRKMFGRAWVAEAVPWRGLLGPASGRAMGMHEDRDGGLWFNHYGNGLFHVTPDGRYQRLTAPENPPAGRVTAGVTGHDGDLPGDRVGAWYQTRDGGIWAGVDHGGLARLRERRFHVIGVNEGLPARTALSVCEETNGVVWIGTAGGGLSRWSEGKLTTFPAGARASANFVFSIAPRGDGSVWLSAAEGEDLYRFVDGELRRVSWEVHGIKCIITDRAGRLWMGMKYGIACWAGKDRLILSTNNNVSLPAVRAIVEGPAGDIWAGADDGTLYLCTPRQLTAFRPKDALADQSIYSLLADQDGTIWVGTFRGGLLRFKGGEFTRFTAKEGLPVDVISQILEDRQGRLWLGTHQGIYCVAKAALNAVAEGRTNTLEYVNYGRHDGLTAVECSDGYQPACWRGADGKLWFTTVRGVVWVNPDEITAKSSPPPVVIEELRVDGEAVALRGGTVVVPPGHKQLDFRFTALSFDAGEKALFRYRLEGLDTVWVDLDTRRVVQLRNLAPGSYRFHVVACNNDGVWNQTGAVLAFEIRPFFYQTLPFNLLLGAAVLAGVAFTVRKIAAAKYRRQLARLEQQHAIERDRARIAKDIHDDIGAGLTQITLLTELARREPEQTDANLERITHSARKLTKAMDEIVWAVDPQHDTFEGLLDYISAYAEDFLRVAGIRCRMDLPTALPATHIDAEQRYNLFLALKEVLNNIVKHAQATEVWLRLNLAEKSFTFIVEDNGRGMAQAGTGARPERLSSGSGMANLENRLAAIGGRCQVHSEPGQGTRVELTVFLKAAASPVVAIGADESVN